MPNSPKSAQKVQKVCQHRLSVTEYDDAIVQRHRYTAFLKWSTVNIKQHWMWCHCAFMYFSIFHFVDIQRIHGCTVNPCILCVSTHSQFKNLAAVQPTLKLTSSRPLHMSSLIGGSEVLSAWASTTARNEFYSKHHSTNWQQRCNTDPQLYPQGGTTNRQLTIVSQERCNYTLVHELFQTVSLSDSVVNVCTSYT